MASRLGGSKLWLSNACGFQVEGFRSKAVLFWSCGTVLEVHGVPKKRIRG